MAAYLIAEEGPLSGLVVRFEEGEEWILGRDPDIAGQVLEDPMVSRKHVICRLTPEGYLLENLSSVNPATQNGKVITEPVLLREGDIIQIGSTFFRFTEEEPISSLPPSYGHEIEPHFEEPEAASYELPVSQDRWMIKVISGPNTGAEFTLQPDHVYIIGKDPNVSDIIFQDLSVSRQHARLIADPEGKVFIEDLGSRNGVILNGELISDKKELVSQDLVALGTTSFLIIDRLETRETIFAPPSFAATPVTEKVIEEKKEVAAVEAPKPRSWKEMIIPKKHVMVASGFAAILLIVFISMIGLFSSKPIEVPQKNRTDQIKEVLAPYPSIQFSWSGDGGGKLFLVGHVLTGVEHQELLYKLKNLGFIYAIEDNVVVDEYVWQNMNALLATNPDWIGVSIHSPVPGKFVMRGYLQTPEQAQALQDYMNRQFPYLDRLDNQVVIGTNLNTQIQGMLTERGYSGVSFQLINGDLVLSGNAPESSIGDLTRLVEALKSIRGIRSVKNFIVFSTEISSRTDISQKYQVTGSSIKDGKSFSVVINGRILSKGDLLDGMVITDIDQSAVLLEKDGMKFRINYNLQ
jgi:type III secretion system YscD/HrpQ family protein